MAQSRKRKLCLQIEIGGMPIAIYQSGRENFTVRYWKQIETGLSYAVAATRFGENVFHALACEGKLDNSKP